MKILVLTALNLMIMPFALAGLSTSTPYWVLLLAFVMIFITYLISRNIKEYDKGNIPSTIIAAIIWSPLLIMINF